MAMPSSVRLLALLRRPLAKMLVMASLEPLLVLKMMPGTMDARGVKPRPFTAMLRRISPWMARDRSAVSDCTSVASALTVMVSVVEPTSRVRLPRASLSLATN